MRMLTINRVTGEYEKIFGVYISGSRLSILKSVEAGMRLF